MPEIDKKKSLFIFIAALLLFLAVVFAVLGVSFLLKKGEALKPAQSSGEFPPSPALNFPGPPQFFNIAGLYFAGPMSLDLVKEQSAVYYSQSYGLYAVLCKKEENYDIIYLGQTGQQEPEQKCLLENCQQDEEALYFAFLWTPKESPVYNNKSQVLEFLREQIKPACLSKE